jgi:hypothetical protein
MVRHLVACGHPTDLTARHTDGACNEHVSLFVPRVEDSTQFLTAFLDLRGFFNTKNDEA